jgi:hypothetical protein
MNHRILGPKLKSDRVKVILALAVLFTIGVGVSSADAFPVDSLIPEKDLPEGWVLIHGPQIYTRKTLFQRINGQAELFFKYGFQKSVSALYQNKKKAKDQVEVDLYDMGNVLQAFGIFSRFRSEDRPAGVGLESYLEDTSLLFYKGRYFIMLYAAEANPSLLQRMAMTISSGITDSSPPPKEINYFPKNGLKPGSIQYYSEGLLGYHFLKRGFLGTYIDKVEIEEKEKQKVKDETKDNPESEGKEFTLFLAIFKKTQDATGALKIYKDHLSQKGKVDSRVSSPYGSNALKGEDPYRGKVILVAKGLHLAGVIGFGNDKDGENLLTAFLRNIR